MDKDLRDTPAYVERHVARGLRNLPPAVSTSPTDPIASRLPQISEQLEAFESTLRTGRFGEHRAEPTCDGQGFVIASNAHGGSGTSEFIRLGDGVWLASGTMQLDRPLATWSRSRGGIALTVAIRGGWQFGSTLAPNDLTTVTSGYAAISVLGHDVIHGCLPFVGMPNEYVGLQFRSEAAMRAFGLSCDALAALLGEPGLIHEARTKVFVVEACAELIGAARAMRKSSLSGIFRQLYMKAKAYELMAHLAGSPRVRDPKRAIHAGVAFDDASLAAMVLASMGDGTVPFDLRLLARQFGVTESRVTRAFRTTYGTTPFCYANRARIARGREMLLESRASLIEIALACGYEHHSSFTTAYRRTYGETPRETRLTARRNGPQWVRPSTEFPAVAV